MVNFFKKLTASLKMQGEEDLLDEKENHADAQPESGNDEVIHIEPEEQEDEQPEVSEPEPEDDGGSVQSADAEEERPYTIAELAKASTSERKSGLKGRLPVFSHAKEEEGEVSMPSAPEGQLAIDVYETPSEIVIKSTIAGVKAEDLDIGIEENAVNIRGARHNEEKVKGEDYFYQECYWGTFSRSIILPIEVDNENASAALEDGILTIRLPKIKKAKETKIKVVRG